MNARDIDNDPFFAVPADRPDTMPECTRCQFRIADADATLVKWKLGAGVLALAVVVNAICKIVESILRHT
jgi:hypothetical protein